MFGVMKRGAYLINVSRGALVDTGALVRALRSSRLAGAGLDVVEPEPLPRGHPLWKMPNVILTPHLAGTSTSVPLGAPGSSSKRPPVYARPSTSKPG
ncbi:MAG TPA: NAD(P)-dependent oxidoreductase [Gemmatimonadales bacterium]|nr:NAD(P)-dependent oxidoreductase [Gemmatimonadales bacterium]